MVLHLENIDDPAEVWKYLETKFQPLGIVKEYTAWIDHITVTFNGKDLRSFCDEYEFAFGISHSIYSQHQLAAVVTSTS